MANTHDHEIRPYAHPYRITDNCHLISCPAQNLHQPQEGWLEPIQARDRTQTELPVLPTDGLKDDKLFRATLLKAASHHIPTGRCKLYTQQVPAKILAMMEERDDLCKQDPASPQLSTMNDEISKVALDHKRQRREFVESIDHRTDSTKLRRTIKEIDRKSKQTAENEGITFTWRPHTSTKVITNSFNCQYTTSKLGKHSSSRRTHQVSKDVKWMSLEEEESFASDQCNQELWEWQSIRPWFSQHLPLEEPRTTSYRTPHNTPEWLPQVLPPSVDLEDLISHPDSKAQQPMSLRRSSYPLSTNFSHQLKINTASDPDTRLHLPSSSPQQTSRQASTSRNHLTAQCVWP